MDESLRRLSRCLTEAGKIVEQIASEESTGVALTKAGAQTPRENVISSSTPSSANRRAAMSSISQAVDRARSMLNQSQLRETCSGVKVSIWNNFKAYYSYKNALCHPFVRALFFSG